MGESGFCGRAPSSQRVHESHQTGRRGPSWSAVGVRRAIVAALSRQSSGTKRISFEQSREVGGGWRRSRRDRFRRRARWTACWRESTARCPTIRLAPASATSPVPTFSTTWCSPRCRTFGDDAHTQQVTARVLADGTAWMSGSRWRDRAVLRASVSNWSTNDSDVAVSIDAVRRAVGSADAAADLHAGSTGPAPAFTPGRQVQRQRSRRVDGYKASVHAGSTGPAPAFTPGRRVRIDSASSARERIRSLV